MKRRILFAALLVLILCLSACGYNRVLRKSLSDPGNYQKYGVTVTATPEIYMDGNYFFIAQVEKDGIEYLPFEEGLQNIIRMMKRHRSLF